MDPVWKEYLLPHRVYCILEEDVLNFSELHQETENEISYFEEK